MVLSVFLLSADFVRFVPYSVSDAPTKVKATFIYNFTKYIEWPSDHKTGNFIIGVMGNQNFYNELSQFFATKRLGSQIYEIKLYNKAADITGKCHLLFIPSNYSGSISELVAKVKGKSTLVVTDKPGLAKQGAAINFVSVENKQKFELNKNNAEKNNLKVSTSLQSLAILIE